MSQQSTRATIAITCVLLPAVLVGAFTLLFGGNTRGASAAPAQGPLAAPGGVAVRWGFYITYNPNSLQSLQANARYLTHVSPWFYSLNASAQVMGNDQANVSQIIRSAGAKNLPMLKNTGAEYDIFTGIMSDTNKVNSIVDQIDALITANNYDGITIDFEALNPQDKTRLTIFMSRLYDRLHPKGKLVVAVVAPKTRDVNTGWAAAYDYPALGRVVDYVLIMAYDYAWVNGDPGPIAPMPKLRETAAYALARIAPEQIIWGTGVYGYDWVVGPDGKSLTRAESRTWAEADALSRQPGAQSGYDSAAFSPWVRYSQNGQPRVVWYEDKRSFQGKIELITNRSIGGFALWRLGQEDPAIWPVIASVPTPVPVTPTRSAFPTKPGPSTPYVPPTATPALPTSTPTPTPKPLACNIIAPFSSTQDKLYFPETGHSLGGAFLKYWRANGGLPVYGFPLSEEFTEKSPTDGKTYTV
jgi:spore germination protein